MEQINLNRHYIVRKTNPAVYLFSSLLKLGLNSGQIKGIMSGRKVSELLNVLNDVQKSELSINKASLFIQWARVIKAKKKPRQRKLPRI